MVSAKAAKLEEDSSYIFEDPSIPRLADCAKKDAGYQEALQLVENGAIAQEIQKLPRLHTARQLLHVWDLLGIASKGERKLLVVNSTKVFVPQEARGEILKALHKSHMGINRTHWSCLPDITGVA